MTEENQASALREGAQGGKPVERIPTRLRCIAVGSGKGGVGKTMISTSLATCLARMKFHVLMFDADLGLANVDLQMGIEPAFTLQDVVFGNCSLEQAVVAMPGGPDVLAAAAGSPDLVDLGAARQQMLVDDLVRFAAQYDFLVIDVGAGIGRNVTTFLAAAPEVAVVVANEPTSIMDAYSLIKVLRQQPDPPTVMMVVNMVRSIDEGELLARRLNGITKKFLGIEVPVAGVVTYDPIVGDAIRARVPLVTYAARSGPGQCIEEMARFFAYTGPTARAPVRAEKDFFGRLAEIGMQGKSIAVGQ